MVTGVAKRLVLPPPCPPARWRTPSPTATSCRNGLGAGGVSPRGKHLFGARNPRLILGVPVGPGSPLQVRTEPSTHTFLTLAAAHHRPMALVGGRPPPALLSSALSSAFSPWTKPAAAGGRSPASTQGKEGRAGEIFPFFSLSGFLRVADRLCGS